jgi:hypothetical protein
VTIPYPFGVKPAIKTQILYSFSISIPKNSALGDNCIFLVGHAFSSDVTLR